MNDSAILEFVLYLGLTAIMVVVALVVHAATAGKRNRAGELLQDAWREAATSHGLTFFAGAVGTDAHPGHIEGQLEEHPISIDAAEVNGRRVTRFRVPLSAPISFAFKVEAVERGSRSRVKTGDARFDQCFEIDAPDPNRVLQLLTAEVRLALLELDALRPSPSIDTVQLVLDQDGITCAKLGILSPDKGLIACAAKTVECARLVELSEFGA